MIKMNYHLHFIKEGQISVDSGYNTVFHEAIYADSYDQAKADLLEKYKNENITILNF